jgi:hypothetical protein
MHARYSKHLHEEFNNFHPSRVVRVMGRWIGGRPNSKSHDRESSNVFIKSLTFSLASFHQILPESVQATLLEPLMLFHSLSGLPQAEIKKTSPPLSCTGNLEMQT